MKNKIFLMILQINLAINAMEYRNYNGQYNAIGKHYKKTIFQHDAIFDDNTITFNPNNSYLQGAAVKLDIYEDKMNYVKDLVRLSQTCKDAHHRLKFLIYEIIKHLAEKIIDQEDTFKHYNFHKLASCKYSHEMADFFYHHPNCTFLAGKALSGYIKENPNCIFDARGTRRYYSIETVNSNYIISGLLSLVRQDTENNNNYLYRYLNIFKDKEITSTIIKGTLHGLFYQSPKSLKIITNKYPVQGVLNAMTFYFDPINEPFNYETANKEYNIRIDPVGIINEKKSDAREARDAYYLCTFEQK